MLLACIIAYSQPAHFGFRVYNMLLCEGYVLTQHLDPIDVICVCPALRPINNSAMQNINLLTHFDYQPSIPIGFTSLPLYADSSH
jgi:hypothetical protein